jgi:hypothetical protein
MKHAFCGGGLSGIDMSYDTDIPAVLDGYVRFTR